ncbi:MAG TPA: hypothetical protein P5525_23505 [Candidatus Paceibacterota bacterium]|nr:hypothetical protein [Candidatus Paceibacterota bacterium]
MVDVFTAGNAWLRTDIKVIDERSGYVALHEWLNQQCSATSNMMPYPDGETLWNNYVIHLMGYRDDTGLNPWPWISHRRDVMTQIIRPTMWRRWSALDPYASVPIGRWLLFAGRGPEAARAVTQAPDAEGKLIERDLDRYGKINLTDQDRRHALDRARRDRIQSTSSTSLP